MTRNNEAGAEMKKLLTISVLCGLSGCAQLQNLPFIGPPAVTSPATPVFFQPLSATLDQPSLTTISSVAKAAAQNPDKPVFVTGAADSVGTNEANDTLATARAQAVEAALVADGIPASRIHTRSIGVATSPAAPGMPAQSARRALIQIGRK
jgi:outer membrane protein OmpA-like peptidoglycan-associated protein